MDTVVDGYSYIPDQVELSAVLPNFDNTGDMYYMPLKRENTHQFRQFKTNIVSLKITTFINLYNLYESYTEYHMTLKENIYLV